MRVKENVKQILTNWLKTHKNGSYRDFENDYTIILNGKKIETPLFNSAFWFKEYIEWATDLEKQGAEWFDIDFTEENEIEDILQGSKVHVAGKVRKKKEKLFVLQYKWSSKSDYYMYPSRKARKTSIFKEIEGQWFDADWKSKFISKQAAESYFKSESKQGYLRNYFLGRQWRILNSKTKEVHDVSIE